MSELVYTKISQLPSATSLLDTDLFIVNANNTTSKLTKKDLFDLVADTIDLSALESEIQDLETTVQSLSDLVQQQQTTINNIITAGFNLIGIE